MSEPMKADALPKRGHVNEVCKEWLVREDGALAYKLQSQEINDFYKGNRYRNEVVRNDFPTALNEQIKEKENAQKQTECYKKFLSEQEEHDKLVAMKISDKLEKDLLEQRQRELEESEQMADQLQSIYVNLPAPGSLEAQPDPFYVNASISDSSHNSRAFSQNHNSQERNSLNSHHEEYQLPIDHLHMNRQSKKSSHNSLHDTHDAPHVTNHMNRSKHHHTQQQSLSADEIIQYVDPVDITSLVGSEASNSPSHNHPYKNNINQRSPLELPSECQLRGDFNFQKIPRDNFAHLGSSNSSHQRLQHMQEHADDIELYVDPKLQEIGLPIEEIKEMSKKIKQEKKDEELARQLQEMEQHSRLTLEDRDRLLAIEAQDKELAKMLQEREKAKAKRAKEKARQRKHQYQKESNSIHSGPLQPLPQDAQLTTSSSKSEEIDPIDLEAYSNPKDLISQISHQRIQSESFRGNSVHSTLDHGDNNKDDDIYTLPVDSCGPNRPASLNHTSESLQNHSLTRSEQFSLSDIQHEPHDSLRMNHSMTSSYDKNSGPAPPYMPIQGTRRCNSNEERKKRSKDKCTHQ